MSEKQYYISRDWNDVYNIWEGCPEWQKVHEVYTYGRLIATYVIELTGVGIEFLVPHLKLEPGQLAKVQRDIVEVYTGFPKMPIFTLGEIIEEHSEK